MLELARLAKDISGFIRFIVIALLATIIACIGIDQIWGWWSELSVLSSKSSSPLPGAILSAIVAATIGLWALRVNAAINLRNKRLDVILHCNTRYEALYKMRTDLAAASSRGTLDLRMAALRRSYFKRYWGLKSDQFDYWLAGYIDQETIASWFMSTVDALNTDKPEVGRLNFYVSLNEMRNSHKIVNQRFVDLIDFITIYIRHIDKRADKYVVLLQYLRIIEKLEKYVIKQLTIHSFSRLWMPEFTESLKREYWQHYWEFSPQMRVAKLARATLTFFHMSPMMWWHEWSGERQLRALCRRLEEQYPHASDTRIATIRERRDEEAQLALSLSSKPYREREVS